MLCERHYCVPPDGVKDHLYRSHQDKLMKKQRKELVKFAASLDLAQPEDVKIPRRECGPVPFLYKEKGLECARCGYCCLLPTSMMEHGRRAHKDPKNEFRHQWVQVLFIIASSIKADYISRHSSYQNSLSNIFLSTYLMINLRVLALKSTSKHCSNGRH